MPTIAIAQSTSNVSTSGSVSTLTATLNGVTAGNTLIVSALWDNVAFTAAASDSQTANGNFGSATQFENGAGSGPNASIWVKQNAEAGTHTVTITITGGNPGIILLLFEEVSGAAATGNPDQHTSFYDSNSNNTTDGTSSGTTSTLNLQPALVYGVCFNAQSTNTPAAGTGFSASLNGTNGVGFAWRTESKRVTATTGVAATFTMSGAASTVITLVVAIDELAGPSITAQPVSTSVYGGGTATFSVSATGTGGLSYQWSRNGSPITGATSSSYTTPALNANDNQSYFTCDVTDSIGTTTSAQAWLTWTAPIVRAVNFVGFLPGFIGEMLTDAVPPTPAAGQTEWSPGRAQAMGHGYLSGEPLPGAIAITIQYGGWDQGPPLSRPQRDPQPLGVDAVDGIGAVASTGEVSGARSRTGRAVLPGTVDPAPPSAQTSVGVAGTFESSVPEARPGRALLDVGGMPAPPSAQAAAGITSFSSASRPLPVRVFVAGEPVEPSAVPAAGSSVTSPTARPPAARVFVTGEPLEPVPNGWAPDAAPAPGRSPRRQVSDQVVAVPAVAVVVLTAWGYEPVQPRGRVSRLAPAGAAGEPVPRALTTPVVGTVGDVATAVARAARRQGVGAVDPVARAAGSAVGIDAPATVTRRQLPAQPAPADAIPTIAAAWGWEASVTGARAPRPVLVVGPDVVAALATAFPATDTSPSPSRAPRAGQGGVAGEAIDHVVVVVPGGFEPSPAFARVTKAEIRSGAFSLPIFLIVPPPIWVMGTEFSVAGAAVVTATSVTAPFVGSDATDASASVTSAGVPSSSTSVTDG